MLRLPGTINLPDSKKRARGRKPAPTRLLSATGVDFDPVWEFRTATAVSAPEGKDIDFGGPVPVEDLGALAAEYGLSKALLTIITEGRLPKRKDGDDSRSAWVFDATCRLIRSGVPNEKILGILTDERLAISESVFENSRGADEYAARTLRRAHAKIREPRGCRLQRASPSTGRQRMGMGNDQRRRGSRPLRPIMRRWTSWTLRHGGPWSFSTTRTMPSNSSTWTRLPLKDYSCAGGNEKCHASLYSKSVAPASRSNSVRQPAKPRRKLVRPHRLV